MQNQSHRIFNPLWICRALKLSLQSQYKYLVIIIDDSLSFRPPIQQLVKKKKLSKNCFFFSLFRKKSCFFPVRTQRDLLLTLLCLCWTMGIICMHHHAAHTHWIQSSRSAEIYRRSQSLHSPPLCMIGLDGLPHRLIHRHIIYKAVVGLLPPYLQVYIWKKVC